MTMRWQKIFSPFSKPSVFTDTNRLSFNEANEKIDRYIHFYNHERIQTKTGVAPLMLRHSYLNCHNRLHWGLFVLSAQTGAVHYIRGS